MPMVLRCNHCNHVFTSSSANPRCSKCGGSLMNIVTTDEMKSGVSPPISNYNADGPGEIRKKIYKKIEEHMEMMQMVQLAKAMAGGDVPHVPGQNNDKFADAMQKQNSELLKTVLGMINKNNNLADENVSDDYDDDDPMTVIYEAIADAIADKKNVPQTGPPAGEISPGPPMTDMEKKMLEYAKTNPGEAAKWIQSNPALAQKMARENPALAQKIAKELGV